MELEGKGRSGFHYLDRTVAFVSDLYADALPALVELDALGLGGDDGARALFVRVLFLFERREQVILRDREMGPVKRFPQVPFVAADRLVDGDQVRAGGERAFDLELGESRQDAWVDVAAAEDLFAKGH